MAMAPSSPAVEDQVRLLPENLHTKKQEHGNQQPLAVPLACPKGAQQNPDEKTATGGKPPTAATTGARKMSLHLELSPVDVGSTHTFAAGRGRHRHGLAGDAEGRIPLVVIKLLGPRDAAAEAAARRPDPRHGESRRRHWGPPLATGGARATTVIVHKTRSREIREKRGEDVELLATAVLAATRLPATFSGGGEAGEREGGAASGGTGWGGRRTDGALLTV